MEFIINIFNVLIFQPLFNVLILLFQYIPLKDFGIAVIALTLLIRAALYPITAYGVKAQKAMADIQPQIDKIKEQFKSDKTEQGRATMALYKQEGVNPFAGIFPLLVQLPIFIALFQLFGRELDSSRFEMLYSFVPNPGIIDPTFLGILNLGETSLAIAVLAGIFQFVQSKQAMPPRSKKKPKKDGPDFASVMQTQMIYIFPLFTVFIVARFPSALGLYWIVTSVATIAQHWYMTRKPTSLPSGQVQPSGGQGVAAETSQKDEPAHNHLPNEQIGQTSEQVQRKEAQNSKPYDF